MSTIKIDNFVARTEQLNGNTSTVTARTIVNGVGKAWVNFGTSGVSKASFNVSSLTSNSGGDTSITMATALLDSNHSDVTAYNNSEAGTGGAGNNSSLQTYLASKTSSVCRVRGWYGSGGGLTDTTDQNVTITR